MWYTFKGKEKAPRETQRRERRGRGVKGRRKALSCDGEALRMTEGMEDNGEAPHRRKIVMVRR